MAKSSDFATVVSEVVTRYKCNRCGEYYDKQRGNFAPAKGELYQFNGYLPICNRCIDKMYNRYLAECGDEKNAVRQVCRKLDLYWSDVVFERAKKIKRDTTLIFKYLSKVNNDCKDKCYDDTLRNEGSLWMFKEPVQEYKDPEPEMVEDPEPEIEPEEPIPDEWIDFWGPGFTRQEYEWLDNRFKYYLGKIDSETIDVGQEILVKQICNLESEINIGRTEGKSVEKSINTLNTLLGSMAWRPSQAREDDAIDATPLGVLIKKFEDERPLPEIDPELEDVDHIIHYVSTFFMGHLAKMVGIKNQYSDMYSREMAKYTIEAPELEDLDEEEAFSELFENWDE